MPHHEEHEEIEGQRECLQEPARTQLLHPVDVPETQEDAMAAYTGSMPDIADPDSDALDVKDPASTDAHGPPPEDEDAAPDSANKPHDIGSDEATVKGHEDSRKDKPTEGGAKLGAGHADHKGDDFKARQTRDEKTGEALDEDKPKPSSKPKAKAKK
ncbi:MAG: hypothetical protein M3R46_13865 [Actinomycetota bacterium]|nr:hypothetical protein [Actinomycetota bacterium]